MTFGYSGRKGRLVATISHYMQLPKMLMFASSGRSVIFVASQKLFDHLMSCGGKGKDIVYSDKYFTQLVLMSVPRE